MTITVELIDDRLLDSYAKLSELEKKIKAGLKSQLGLATEIRLVALILFRDLKERLRESRIYERMDYRMSESKKVIMLGTKRSQEAYEAGVKVSSAYPGTPSTEISENPRKIPGGPLCRVGAE